MPASDVQWYLQDLASFEEGELLALPVWKWLEIAGISSLDDRYVAEGGVGEIHLGSASVVSTTTRVLNITGLEPVRPTVAASRVSRFRSARGTRLCRNTEAGKDDMGNVPSYRVTGILMNFEFKYYNYKNVRLYCL
jgi:hypothetical protein